MHRVLALATVLILLLFSSSVSIAGRCYRITYAFTPQSSYENGYWIPVARLWDGQGVADAQLVDTSPASGSAQAEQCGNSPIQWPEAEAGNQLTAIFDVELEEVVLPVNPSTVWGAYDTSASDYVRNTRAVSGWIQSDDQTIVDRAAAIVGSETSPYKKALAIYNWVRTNLSYQDGVRQDALTALAQRKGDCASYSHLFVALCRAQGIPARNLAGFLAHDQYGFIADQFSEGSWSYTQNGRRFSTHVWSEFLLPDGTWVQLDATHNLWGSIPFERIILTKGNEVALNWLIRPWMHLPVGQSQVQDDTVTVSVSYLGTGGIDHPDPPAPQAAVSLVGPTMLLND